MSRSSRFKRNFGSTREGMIFSLLKEIYPIHEIYVQYPYSDILKRGYKILKTPKSQQNLFLLERAKKLRADLCIPQLSLIIEVQGEFHDHIVDFTGDVDKATSDFYTRQHLDKMKRLIASEAEFRLLEYWYYEKVNRETLEKKLS